MHKIILARLQQKYRTISYPDAPPPELPERFQGHPVMDRRKCPADCNVCSQVCPTQAIELNPVGRPVHSATIDLGKCLFCLDCSNACPQGTISHAREYRLAAKDRQDLIISSDQTALRLAGALDVKAQKLFGHSLKLRQVSAGGCNACEVDTNVLGTVGWDLGRFGIQFVASPRHADGLLVTGPVTRNMELALRKTFDAIPDPKIVIAVGTCAVSGGIMAGHEQVNNGVNSILPVNLYIPGCPPHPLTILEGLLRLLGRLEDANGLPRN